MQINGPVKAVVLAAAIVQSSAAQTCEDGARPGRVAVLVGGFTIAEGAAIALRHDDWWSTPSRSFHFTSGGSPSKGQDLLLHGAIAYQTSQLAAHAWDWTCVSRPAAAWLGAAVGLLVGVPKEIGDGLHAQGFAVDDIAVSAIGAVLPALHRTVPGTRLFRLKVNYWPSAEFRNRPNGLPQLENDYAGQRYFVAINPGRLPGGAGPWPDWLGVAVGHSVPQWASSPPTHEWYVTLDLNLRGIPLGASWWRGLANVLDQVHFPLPGMRINRGEVEFGLF